MSAQEPEPADDDAAPAREPARPNPTDAARPTRGDDPLLDALSDRDASVRRTAAETVGERNDPADTPLLVEALNDPDTDVRYEALWALKYREKPELRDALIPICKDTDARIRGRALETLAELGDDRDTPLLIRGLKDQDEDVRLHIVWALEERVTPASSGLLRGPISEAMKDSATSVREAAVHLHGRLGRET